MSARVARLLAVPFAVLAFALRIGETLWLQPFALRIASPDVSLLAYLGLVAASLAVPAGSYLLLTGQARKRRATWQLDDRGRRFTAPASPHWVGPWAIGLGWAAGGLSATERVPNQDRMRIAQLGALTTVSVVLAAAVLALALLMLLVNRPCLHLDPDGITLHRIVTQVRTRWDELMPGGPPAPAKRDAFLTLCRVTATPVEGPARPWKLPARSLHVDPAFFAYTIRRYVDSPERRAGIGSTAELTALQMAFGTEAAPLA
jgi:hypothetical protein